MKITNYRLIDKGALKGSCNIVISIKELLAFADSEMTIRKVNHFMKDGRSWISLPSEAYMKDGEKKYFQYLLFDELLDKKIKAESVETIKEHLANNPVKTANASEWDKLSEQEIPF